MLIAQGIAVVWRKLIPAAAIAVSLWVARAGEAGFRIGRLDRDGTVTWTNAFPKGIVAVQSASAPTGPWTPRENYFTTQVAGKSTLKLDREHGFHRLLAADISGGRQGFNNLIASYGRLSTVAGKGDFRQDGLNNWRAEFEGGPATAAELSRPHFAMADDAGNIYIVDKDSHALLKVTPAGTIHTVAGTHFPSDFGDGPAPGTDLPLSSPNGGWVRGDGTVYILDTGNGKVRRLDPSGTMRTLFAVPNGIKGGRGLWVRDDENLVYFVSGSDLKRWTPNGGVRTVRNDFIDPGNIAVDPGGAVIVTDRGAHSVYSVVGNNRTRIAGNGTPAGGGDGLPALETGLAGVRGVWLMPHGGYLLATHEGSQVWYVDPLGIIHLFVDGIEGSFRAGDGEWFRSPGFKISEARSVTMDSRGSILITENDAGHVRKIEFQRLWP